MFLRTASTCLFALIGVPLAAQCTGDSFLDLLTPAQQAELSANVADMPYAEGLTWTATRGDDTLTVIGTMHIYDPRLEDIRVQVAPAVSGADLVMLEATPEQEAQLQELIATDPEQIFIVNGPTLPEQLDADTWEMLSAAATDRGIPGFMAAKMQPWYLSLVLAIPPCAMADMMAGAQGLDHLIGQDATDAGIPLQAVEPYTTLFDIFKDAPIDEQIDMLRVSLLAPELQQQMFVSMLDQYFEGDIGRLWEMSRIAMKTMPEVDPAEADEMFAEMQEAMLDGRNRNWIPVITEATDIHDDIVVAVGAAHLVGDQGILRLLENEGWDIAPYVSP